MASMWSSIPSVASASPTASAHWREGGRVVVVGLHRGRDPRGEGQPLLLGNTEVVGAGWGAYVMAKPEVTRRDRGRDHESSRRGVVRPIVGARFPIERAGEALKLIDEREATGKVVLDIANG